MEASSTPARQGLRAVVDDPTHALVALDFDGTLAPITSDPDRAAASVEALRAFGRLGGLVGTVAIITGRSPRKVLELAALEDFPGLGELIILGQYGVERFDAGSGTFHEPPIPPGIAPVGEVLPGFLADRGVDAELEFKGRAIGVHLRNHPNPAAAIAQIHQPLIELVAPYGLVVQPGRLILEVCADGHDKGQALTALVAERGARSVIFGGDDLGDIPAFQAVDTLRAQGIPGVKVCAVSPEQHALVPMADVIVDEVPGVARWLSQLAEAIDQSRPEPATITVSG